MNELPCPFCNSEAKTIQESVISWATVCLSCGARGPEVILPFVDSTAGMIVAESERECYEKAIEGWNKRV